MSFSACEEAITARFVALTDTVNLTVVRDNGPEPADKSARWCRLHVWCSDAKAISFAGAGANKYRIEGNATAEVFAPAKFGASSLRAIGDAIGSAFNGVALTSPDIRFGNPTFGQITQVDGWARREITIPYTFDEVF